MEGDVMKDESREKSSAKQWAINFVTVLFLIGVVYFAINQRPYPQAVGSDAPGSDFSSARALTYLNNVAKAPHPTGSPEHEEVASYIMRQIVEFGLEPQVQDTTLTVPGLRGHVAVRVRNIAVRKKGHSNTKAVLLVGHYDSVVGSPGAGDDGTAVACLLESLRALQSGPALRDDVIFLFTDAEELGLFGARAFLAQHPWAKDVGVVLNFEARGTSGPSILFETINGDGWLVDEFVKAAPNAYGNSLVPAIYKILPNDTDLSAFKGSGIPGLNFAFAEKWANYHTGLDSLSTISQRSVQHHGEYALGLTRRLADMDLTNPPRGNSVFFNLIGSTLIHYPTSWVAIFSGLIALSFLAVVIVGLRKKRITIRGLLFGFAALLVSIILSALLTMLGLRVSAQWSQDGTAFFESGFYYVGLVCLALAVPTLLYIWLSRKTSIENLHMGALILWLALTLVSTVLLPGGTYLFVWPLLIGLALSLYLILTPVDSEPSGIRIAVLWLSALLSLLLLAPMAQMLLVALAGPMGFIVSIIVVLCLGLLLPIYHLISRPRPIWVPALLISAAVVLLGTAVIRADRSTEYPKQNHIFYIANLDNGTAIWATLENREDGWTSQFFDNQGSVIALSNFIPDWRYPYVSVLQRPAPVSDLASPTVKVLEDVTEGDLRRLKLQIASPRLSPEVAVYVESGVDVVAAKLNETVLQDDRVQDVSTKDFPPEGRTPTNLQLKLRCYGLSKDGETLQLETRTGSPVRVHIIEHSYNLPLIPNWEVKPRTAEFCEARSLGDGTLTYRSFTF
jgi:hypothetical protein